MDAREHFQSVVVPSYTQFKRQGDFYSLQNAILSMNTMPEHLGLDRRKYPPIASRNQRRLWGQAIREDNDLTDLQSCADVLKHVRSNTDHGTLSSTGIDPNNPTTWKIGDYDLVQVAHDGFAKLSDLVNRRST
jgi:hypothetical protein